MDNNEKAQQEFASEEEAKRKGDFDAACHRLEQEERGRILRQCHKRIDELRRKELEASQDFFNPLTHGLEGTPRHPRGLEFLKMFRIL